MKLKVHGYNQTEILFSNGDAIFFSYETPVAAWVDGRPYKVSEKYSRTTTKHIKDYFVHDEMVVPERKQEFFDKLIRFDITDLYNPL